MIENIELAELNNSQETKENLFSKKDLAVCGHIKTSAEVVLAQVEITLEELFALKKGSVVETRQSVDSAITLVLNGKPIAMGKLVVSGDHFGFEVTEVKSN
jgi:flagellar motor switch protein FliN